MEGDFVSKSDFAKLAVCLRGAGIPETVVKRILFNEVSAYFEHQKSIRIRAARLANDPPYWQTELAGVQTPKDSSNLERVIEEIEGELDTHAATILQDLFGESFAVQGRRLRLSTLGHGGPRIDFLDEPKRREIAEIWRSTQIESTRLGAREGGVHWRVVADLQQEALERTEALLTVDELYQFRAWNSDDAEKLRRNLGTVKPTREEFDQILGDWITRGWNPFDEDSEHIGKIDDRLRSLLGEERFAEFVRTRQPGYGTMACLLVNEAFPIDKLASLYSLGYAAKKQLRRIKNEYAGADPEDVALFRQRDARCQDIRRELASKVSPVIGLDEDDQRMPRLVFLLTR